jgi:hypothetical protein
VPSFIGQEFPDFAPLVVGTQRQVSKERKMCLPHPMVLDDGGDRGEMKGKPPQQAVQDWFHHGVEVGDASL